MRDGFRECPIVQYAIGLHIVLSALFVLLADCQSPSFVVCMTDETERRKAARKRAAHVYHALTSCKRHALKMLLRPPPDMKKVLASMKKRKAQDLSTAEREQIAQEFMFKINQAAEDDEEAVQEGRPALNKLKMLKVGCGSAACKCVNVDPSACLPGDQRAVE